MTKHYKNNNPPLTRLFLLLLLTLLLHPAMARAEGDGSEGNPYVIDLSSTLSKLQGVYNVSPDNKQINLLKGGADAGNPVYYKLTGGDEVVGNRYAISNAWSGTSANNIVFLIDPTSTVYLKQLNLSSANSVKIDATASATLNISAAVSYNPLAISANTKVTIAANVTVVATVSKVSNFAVSLNNSELAVNGTLYGYGGVNLISATISGTNNTALQWTFPTAPNAALTVTEDGGDTSIFTIPANTTATILSLFAPAGEYNLKNGSDLYYGVLGGSRPTSTFVTTSGSVSTYSDVALPLDLKDITNALSLSYSKSDGWKYKEETKGQETAFNGVVKNTTSSGFFKHPITVTLDNSSGAVDATLVFDQAKNIGSSDVTTALTIERAMDNGNSATLALDIDAMLEGATALKVGDGVTCEVPVKSKKSVTLMATDQAVELGTGAELTGLSSVTFTEAVGSNESFIEPCIVYGNTTEILSGTYKSFAFNLPYEYTVWSLFNDDPLTQYQGKPSTAAGSSDPYQTTFPAVTSGSPYVDYGLVPYALTPSGETTEITIDATENTDVRQIGSDDPTKPTTIQSLTIGGVTTDIILSNLTVKADGGGNGGTVEIGVTNTTTAKFTLKGTNTLGEVIVGSNGTFELFSAEEGATLKGTTFTNNGTLYDLTGLVEAVVVGTTGTTLSPGTITGNTEVSPGGTPPSRPTSAYRRKRVA